MTIRSNFIFLLALLFGFILGCEPPSSQAAREDYEVAKKHAEQKHAAMSKEKELAESIAKQGQRLVAVMSPTASNQAHGTVTFTMDGDHAGGVLVEAFIHGLTPGDHAIHIHQYGDLRKEDGKGTGGHYNPEGHAHSLPTSEIRHAGDLGNLTADTEGTAKYSIRIHNVTLDGSHNPIIGRGVIIHAKVDDGGQPTGNAGPRVSQGVIGYAKPE
jgi:Cu-Zn family superoxide dismutase